MEMESKFNSFSDFADSLWLMGCFKTFGHESDFKKTPPFAPGLNVEAEGDTIPTGGSLDGGESAPEKQPLRRIRSLVIVEPSFTKKEPPVYLHGLSTLRSLRPLKKKQFDLVYPPLLDVEQTVYRITKDHIISKINNRKKVLLRPYHISFTPEKVRVYDLTLIIDTYFTMSFYVHILQNFLDTALQSGIFRRVQVCRLEMQDEKPCVYRQTTLNLPFDRHIRHEENEAGEMTFEQDSDNKILPEDLAISSPRHPKIYLFLSDFFSPIWRNWSKGKTDAPTIMDFIKTLKQNGHFVSLAQILPKYLWDRSALFYFDHHKVSLETHPDLFMREQIDYNPSHSSNELLPVFHLSAEGLDSWARCLAGDVKAKISAIELKQGRNWLEDTPVQLMEEEWKERVESFIQAAPPNTARLTMYLSCMLGKPELLSNQVLYLAEETVDGIEDADYMDLFCSGLLRLTQIQPKFGNIKFAHPSIPQLLINKLTDHKRLQVIFAYTWRYLSKESPEKQNQYWHQFFEYQEKKMPVDENAPEPLGLLKEAGLLNNKKVIAQNITDADAMPKVPTLNISLWGGNARDRQLLIRGLMRYVYKLGQQGAENSWQVQELGRYGQTFTPNYLMRPVEPTAEEFGADKVFLIRKEKVEAVFIYHDFPEQYERLPNLFYNSCLMSQVLLICVSWNDLGNDQKRASFSHDLLELYYWANRQQNPRYKVFFVLQDAPASRKAPKREKTSKERSEEVYNLLLKAGIEKTLCDSVFVDLLASQRAFSLPSDYNSADVLFEELRKEML